MGGSGALRPPTWTRRSGGTGGHSAGTDCPSGLLIWCPREAASRGPRGEVEWAPWLEENIASVFGVVGRLGSGCEVLIRERCRADAGARLQPRQGLGRGGPQHRLFKAPRAARGGGGDRARCLASGLSPTGLTRAVCTFYRLHQMFSLGDLEADVFESKLKKFGYIGKQAFRVRGWCWLRLWAQGRRHVFPRGLVGAENG